MVYFMSEIRPVPVQRGSLIKRGWDVAKASRDHRVYYTHRDYCKGHNTLYQQVGILIFIFIYQYFIQNRVDNSSISKCVGIIF